MNADLILDDINNPGPSTRSRTYLGNFYGSFSFISILEPTKYDEAMTDPDWMNAMQEELV